MPKPTVPLLGGARGGFTAGRFMGRSRRARIGREFVAPNGRGRFGFSSDGQTRLVLFSVKPVDAEKGTAIITVVLNFKVLILESSTVLNKNVPVLV